MNTNPTEGTSETETGGDILQLQASSRLIPWEADAETGTFTSVGPHAVALLGYPLEAWYAPGFWMQIIHPEEREATILACHRAKDVLDHYVLEYRMLAADGRAVWIKNIIAVDRTSANRVLLRGYLIDISSRKQTEAALGESESLYRLLAENSTDLICRFTPGAVCTYVSPAVTTLLGYQPGEWLGRSGFDFIHPDDEAATQGVLAQMMSSHDPVAATFRLRAKDGCYLWIECHGRGRLDPSSGVIREIFTTGRDITDRVETQERLRHREVDLARAERLNTMAQMGAELAHELNQPLYAIGNFADTCLNYLRQAKSPQPELLHWIEMIAQQSRRAGDIFRRINSFVRKGELDLSRLDINTCVRDTLLLIEFSLQSRGIEVKLDLARDLPSINADRLLIEQVLVNLIRNGIEALQELPAAPQRLAIRTFLAPGPLVGVEVTDSGNGFSPEIAGRLFEPFFTTKSDGTGLGLPFCRSTIEAHGGRVTAKNAEPSGAAFQLVLPVAAKSEQ